MLGRAPRSGRGGRTFKSCVPDDGEPSRQMAPAAVPKTVGAKARERSTRSFSARGRCPAGRGAPLEAAYNAQALRRFESAAFRALLR
jgi:hypothetical protein